MPGVVATVCVFCGSNVGLHPSYAIAAAELGESIARTGRRLVYGGGKVGLMGVLADAAIAAGGHVTGVIPSALVAKEVAHSGLSELVVTETMHERKAVMAELSDGFIALPGGMGTLEELLEVVTWAQLGLHRKPVVVLDVNGFFRPLFTMLERTVDAGFTRHSHLDLAIAATTVPQALALLEQPVAPPAHKWMDMDEI